MRIDLYANSAENLSIQEKVVVRCKIYENLTSQEIIFEYR